jgi:ElaA protein
MSDAAPIAWHLSRLKSLSGPDVYDILALRQKVFLIEQVIPVLDADGLDAEAWHLCGRGEAGLVAYARIFVPETEGGPVKIGRVVVAEEARGQGLGRALMERALHCAAELAPGAPVKVSAQAYLTEFYESLGFVVDSHIYDDHGVAHVDMVRGNPSGGPSDGASSGDE